MSHHARYLSEGQRHADWDGRRQHGQLSSLGNLGRKVANTIERIRDRTRASKAPSRPSEEPVTQAELAPLRLEDLANRNYQRQSPFFRLPSELRLQIYSYVLGGSLIHIRRRPGANGKLYNIRCKCDTCPGTAYGSSETSRWPQGWACDGTKHLRDGDKYSAALLYTCARSYTEGLAVMYEENTFGFKDTGLELLGPLERFMERCGTQPRRVCIDAAHARFEGLHQEGNLDTAYAICWDNLWMQLEKMHELKELEVRIICGSWEITPELVLEPVRRFKNLRHINEPEEDTGATGNKKCRILIRVREWPKGPILDAFSKETWCETRALEEWEWDRTVGQKKQLVVFKHVISF